METSPTSALALADPPVIARLRLVFQQLSDYTSANGSERTKKYGWLMHSIMEEVLDELADANEKANAEVKIALYFGYFGRLIEWCGSGDETILPDTLRNWLYNTGDIHAALWGAAEETEKELTESETLALSD